MITNLIVTAGIINLFCLYAMQSLDGSSCPTWILSIIDFVFYACCISVPILVIVSIWI